MVSKNYPPPPSHIHKVTPICLNVGGSWERKPIQVKIYIQIEGQKYLLANYSVHQSIHSRFHDFDSEHVMKV